MSYDKPHRRERYVLPSSAYGATAGDLIIKGPKGKTGLVKDIIVHLTANAVGTTTVPELNVGATSGASTYARFRLGTTAILGYLAASTPFRARALAEAGAAFAAGGIAPILSDFAGHVALETARIPADTAVFITGVIGVGGTPAGTYSAEIDIDWD